MSAIDQSESALARQIRSLAMKLAKSRENALKFKNERDALANQVQEHVSKTKILMEENQTMKQNPSEQIAELERLKGEIRLRDHKAAFEAQARTINVRQDAIDDLWKITNYSPTSDAIDNDQIKNLISQAVSSRPWLVESTQSDNPSDGMQNQIAHQGANPAPVNNPLAAQTYSVAPGPGLSRGAQDRSAGGNQIRIRRADMADPAFMYKNQSMIATAHKDGKQLIVID